MNDRRSKSAREIRNSIKSLTETRNSMKSLTLDDLDDGLSTRSVSFGQLQILEFDKTLGDNPGCTDGVPLTIEWVPTEVTNIGVDYYELTRSPRRARKDLAISSAERQIYLLSIGYRINELFEADEKVRKIKKERAASFRKQQRWGKFVKVVESAANAMRSVLIKPTKYQTPPSPVKRNEDTSTDESLKQGYEINGTQNTSFLTTAA